LIKGDILQFERKNFYILDSKIKNSKGGFDMTFFLIPDGKDTAN
jgi:hypothetical protein